MKKKIFTLMFLSVLFVGKRMQAQDLDTLMALMSLYVQDYDTSGLVYFKSSTLKQGEPYAMYVDSTGDSIHQLELVRHWEDSIIGMKHYRYQETFKGLKVEAAEYSEHATQDEYLVLANGKIAVFDVERSADPDFSEEEAFATILEAYPDDYFAWLDEDWEDDLKDDLDDPDATYYPEGELLWALDDYKNLTWNISSARYRLTWQFKVFSLDPNYDKAFYVDALTGELFREDNLRCDNGPANILTQGSQIIDTKWKGWPVSKYILRANNNSRDIHTKYNSSSSISWGLTSNIKDSDDNWGSSEQLGTTAHWMVTQAWDFFKTQYNRNGLDGSGTVLRVQADDPYPGAQYRQAVSGFAKRDYIKFGHFVGSSYASVIDVAGHEYSHGVDQYTAKLVYRDEPGALDESFADIFGFMVERYAEGGVTDWLLGEDAVTLRSIENPKSEGKNYPNVNDCNFSRPGQPDTYKGTYWHTGPCDRGGVHVNSGVQNYWFYLLAQGGTGINDNNYSYNVQGIGIDKAALITYFSLVNFHKSGSQYIDARALAIGAAQVLYGHCSNEYIQTENAWAAVGLGSQSSCPVMGVPEVTASKPKLYPNPASDQITLSFSNTKKRMIRLYSISGALKMELGSDDSDELIIKTADLSSGVYLLRIQEQRHSYTMKFIKK